MPLSKEQLLIPRYKVVIDYPASEFYIDDVLWLEHEEDGRPYINKGEYVVYFPDLYASVFKQIPWWSDRKPEDMPDYVRYSEYYLNHYHLDGEFRNMIFKVENWSNGHYGIKAKGGGIIHGYEINFEPADESEYTAYINQKQQ